MSRTSKSIRNIKYAIVGQLVVFLITFIARTIFVKVLGAEYLGINGLFTNILSILSLAELGIGASIVFSLYKPLAENDRSKVKALMQLFRKFYIFIGVVVAVLGLSFTPFLEHVIKDMPDIPHIHLIYIMFVINLSLTYFFSYKRSLLFADQNSHLVTLYQHFFFSGLNIGQIIILIFTQNYFLFIGVKLLFTLLENLLISIKVNKMYPFMKETDIVKIDEEEKKIITRNIKAMMWHKVGTTVVMGTDSLLISKFVGIIAVGVYSNYLLITNALNTIFSLVFRSITASIGNLGVEENKDKKEFVFYTLNIFGFWVYGFASISLFVLLNPFIDLWLGKGYLFSEGIVFIIVLNFYLTGMRKNVLTFKDAFGLFWNDRYKPLLEALVNLVVSITLVKYFGIMGIFVGTTISTLSTAFWIEPYVLYKYGFKSSVKPYFIKHFIYSVFLFIVGYITWLTSLAFPDDTLISFIVKVLICAIIPNLLFIIIFWRNQNFKYLLNIIMRRLKLNVKYNNSISRK
ncbi:lipopolysaccharide biosynthesis protein [Planococcus donghaensis]|uniref:lipopolysaccharide biosynthesis protein n=1 Tax=Planococcus donghaensis TaxID=414778 RepID=UPI0037354797